MCLLQKYKPPAVTDGDISVNVTDGTNAIAGVSLTLTDNADVTETATTDESGNATFESISVGTYSLTAEKEGYLDKTVTVTVDGDVSVNIEMTITRNVNFTITDGTDGIASATVVIDETIEKTTGVAGGCTASLTDGEHSITVTKEGYVTKTETITVSEEDTTFTITVTAE